MRDIQATFTERFLKIQVSAEPPRRAPPPPPPVARSADEDLFAPATRTGPASGAGPGAAPAVSSSLGRVGQTATAAGMREVGRNDPCPCGSGKKYKKCHGVGK
ncbi:MAG TPA: SEC-C metal-binding domain-containing protein, partial [Gemmatimonadales bacterium]|nr:SEC-C metal-binding domain-containing protein [Gemmatimonadales bacterium]